MRLRVCLQQDRREGRSKEEDDERCYLCLFWVHPKFVLQWDVPGVVTAMLLCLGQCAAGNGHGMYRLKIGGLVKDPLLESQSTKSTLYPLLKNTHTRISNIHTHTHLSRSTKKPQRKWECERQKVKAGKQRVQPIHKNIRCNTSRTQTPFSLNSTQVYIMPLTCCCKKDTWKKITPPGPGFYQATC